MFEEIKIILHEKIVELLQPRPIATVIALLLLAAILIVISRKTNYNVRTLTYGALAIAASFILSYIKIVSLPYGGTITLASMLPMFIFAYIAGPKAGLLAGLSYGLLQYIQEPFFVHWVQFLLDYPLAFSLLGLAGLFRKNHYLGAVVGSMGRFVCHFLSGVVFFASYAGDQNVFVYSLMYNMSYILPDMLICIAVLAIPSVRGMINRLRVISPESVA
jgi:thiamine transporter